jgi:hypothetical protein
MTLSESERIEITAAVEVLAEKGPVLGRPRVDTLDKGSAYPNMKELRIQYAGKPYRILFAFDPRQTGILLIGGIKSGKGWTKRTVSQADNIYSEYLKELKKEGLI